MTHSQGVQDTTLFWFSLLVPFYFLCRVSSFTYFFRFGLSQDSIPDQLGFISKKLSLKYTTRQILELFWTQQANNHFLIYKMQSRAAQVSWDYNYY